MDAPMKELSSDTTGSAPQSEIWAWAGFSLVEVLLALALLGIGLSLATSLLSRGQLVHEFSQRRLQQIELSSQVLAELRLAQQPQRLAETLSTHPGTPLLRYRARVVEAKLPEALRLVEVEVVPRQEAASFHCRGVVPGQNLVLNATPVPGATSIPPPNSPTAGA